MSLTTEEIEQIMRRQDRKELWRSMFNRHILSPSRDSLVRNILISLLVAALICSWTGIVLNVGPLSFMTITTGAALILFAVGQRYRALRLVDKRDGEGITAEEAAHFLKRCTLKEGDEPVKYGDIILFPKDPAGRREGYSVVVNDSAFKSIRLGPHAKAGDYHLVLRPPVDALLSSFSARNDR